MADGRWYFNDLGATNETAAGACLSWRGTSLHSSHVQWHQPTAAGCRLVAHRETTPPS